MHQNMKLIASAYRKLDKPSRLCSLAFSRFLKENVFQVKTTKKKKKSFTEREEPSFMGHSDLILLNSNIQF